MSEIIVDDNLTCKPTSSSKNDESRLSISVEMLLFRENDNFLKTEQLLQAKRKKYLEEKEKFNQKWSNLRSDEVTFKQNFLQFNKFMLSNAEKRKRAYENLEYQKRVRIVKEKDIRSVEAEISRLQNIKVRFDEELKKYICYKVYLDKVALLSLDTELKLKGLDDIINCFERYLNVAKDISDKQILQFQQLQESKQKMDCYIEECKEKTLEMHTRVADLRTRYEENRRKTQVLEHLVSGIRNQGYQKWNDAVMTKSAIWNLYQFMSKRSRFAQKFQKNDIENQLMFIKNTLNHVMKINKKQNKKGRKNIL